MPQVRFVHIGGRVSPLGWLVLILTMAALLSLFAAVTVVAFSIFLFIAPALAVLALGFYLYRVFFGRPRRTRGPDIIDGEFRVIEPGSYRTRDNGSRRP